MANNVGKTTCMFCSKEESGSNGDTYCRFCGERIYPNGQINNPEDHWVNMPEYNNTKQEKPLITATFKFKTEESFLKFKQIVQEHVFNGEKVFDGMQKKDAKQSWYPHKEKASKYLYIDNTNTKPLFPVYIVSKGRWNRRPTANMLEENNIPYYIIVEENEYEKYINVCKGTVLILPKEYKENYDMFWNDEDRRTGPGPARNFAWDHSLKNGYDWHWVLDDNIESIERFNNNLKVKCVCGTPFRIMEDFVLRYDNIAIAGPQYSIFCPANEDRPPISFNTRIYSFLLIRNDIPFRWRGRYNEDTDLSLRVLKAGWCTVQFNSFLQGKRATQTVSGGNSEEFYDKEGTLKKSQMLVDMHPDVAKITKKFNRDHHSVNYNSFKKNNKLLKKKEHKDGINYSGMVLIEKINNH